MRPSSRSLWFLCGLLASLMMPAWATARNGAEPLFAFDQHAGSVQRAPAEALGPLFAASIRVPAPGGTFARDPDAAIDALRAGALANVASLSWVPVRAGVSADRTQGFTMGYQRHVRTDGETQRAKYLAYWIRTDAEWRMIAYRVVAAPADGGKPKRWKPFAPEAIDAVPARIAGHRVSLAAAEQQFSNRAQAIGLGPAFAEFGRDDAANLGGPRSPEIVRGAASIAALVAEGEPAQGSSVHWAADEAVDVASSGDLGVTFGFIRFHDSGAGETPPPIPFFTVWARADAERPWRYIAE